MAFVISIVGTIRYCIGYMHHHTVAVIYNDHHECVQLRIVGVILNCERLILQINEINDNCLICNVIMYHGMTVIVCHLFLFWKNHNNANSQLQQ